MNTSVKCSRNKYSTGVVGKKESGSNSGQEPESLISAGCFHCQARLSERNTQTPIGSPCKLNLQNDGGYFGGIPSISSSSGYEDEAMLAKGSGKQFCQAHMSDPFPERPLPSDGTWPSAASRRAHCPSAQLPALTLSAPSVNYVFLSVTFTGR